MINLIRAIRDRIRYDRLHYYRALDHLDRDEALARLKVHAKQARMPAVRWIKLAGYAVIVLGFFLLAEGVLSLGEAVICMGFGALATIGCAYYNYVRLRERFDAVAEAEKRDGRLLSCLDCGYDLRGTDGEVCAECGRAMRVVPAAGKAT